MNFDELSFVLSRMKYKKEWRIRARLDAHGPVLVLEHITLCSINKLPIALTHETKFPITSLFTEYSVVAFVRDRLVEAETHEALEWLELDGKKVSDPHLVDGRGRKPDEHVLDLY